MRPFNALQWNIQHLVNPHDQMRIRTMVANADGPCSRFLVFLNGRSEWAEKYHEVKDDVRLPSGTGFVTMDHRGQGASEAMRGHVHDYDDFVEDLRVVVDTLVQDKPFDIVAHSMGGLIALYATLKGKVHPRRLVLCSPLLRLPEHPIPSPWTRFIARSMCRLGLHETRAIGGNFEKPRFEENRLTHDPDRYEQMRKTPYPVPAPTFGWLDATFRATDFVFQNPQVPCPTLVLGGSEEGVVNPSGFSEWAKFSDSRFRWVQGARHELLTEIPQYRDQALQWIRDFLYSAP